MGEHPCNLRSALQAGLQLVIVIVLLSLLGLTDINPSLPVIRSNDRNATPAEKLRGNFTIQPNIVSAPSESRQPDKDGLMRAREPTSRDPNRFSNYQDRWRPITSSGRMNPTYFEPRRRICSPTAEFIAQNPRCSDKVALIEELAAAGVCPEPEYCDQLPSWRQVTEIYGDKPVILGLDTCEAYRKLIGDEPPMPKIAGLWNTGSSALSKTFLYNMMLYNRGWTIDRATVTWGKHTPLYLKYRNTYPARNRDDRDKILPVVVVRDPLRWMVSMCRKSYGAHWKVVQQRCPNLIPTASERVVLGLDNNTRTYVVDHTNMQARYRYHTPYESLAQMWSSWNRDYLDASFPRLIIRMEDMIFFPEQVIRTIGNCSGMPIRDDFYYVSEKGKQESSSDLLHAMIKYGTNVGRVSSNLTSEERLYLQTALDPQLMKLLNYPLVPLNDRRYLNQNI